MFVVSAIRERRYQKKFFTRYQLIKPFVAGSLFLTVHLAFGMHLQRKKIGLKKITRLETVNKNQENYTENKLLNATSADDIFTLLKCIVDVSQYSSNAHQHRKLD